MKRLSLRVRLTLLFFLLTSAAWGIACVIAWQHTTDKLDKLFDTQQLLFARRLSAINFDELHALTAPMQTKKKIKHGHLDDDALAFVKKGRSTSDPLNTTKVDMPPKGGNPALSDDDVLDIISYLRFLAKSESQGK